MMLFEKRADTCERVEGSWLELPGDLRALPKPSRAAGMGLEDLAAGHGWERIMWLPIFQSEKEKRKKKKRRCYYAPDHKLFELSAPN